MPVMKDIRQKAERFLFGYTAEEAAAMRLQLAELQAEVAAGKIRREILAALEADPDAEAEAEAGAEAQ